MKTSNVKMEVASKIRTQFGFTSKLMCIIALAAIVALACPFSLASQQQPGHKPLVLTFAAIFAPKVGLGPSLKYEFQAESFFPAAKVAMAWGKQYYPQHVLVSLAPKSAAPEETYTAIFDPRVGEGPSMQYEFLVGKGSTVQNEETFLRTVRLALGWGREYCPQNILVSFVPKSSPQETGFAQDAVIPNAGVNPEGLVATRQPVFTARFVSRDSGLVIQQEVQANSLIEAARKTLAWGKQHCPEHVLFSLIQN